jgi:hypothetical protein
LDVTDLNYIQHSSQQRHRDHITLYALDCSEYQIHDGILHFPNVALQVCNRVSMVHDVHESHQAGYLSDIAIRLPVY